MKPVRRGSVEKCALNTRKCGDRAINFEVQCWEKGCNFEPARPITKLNKDVSSMDCHLSNAVQYGLIELVLHDIKHSPIDLAKIPQNIFRNPLCMPRIESIVYYFNRLNMHLKKAQNTFLRNCTPAVSITQIGDEFDKQDNKCLRMKKRKPNKYTDNKVGIVQGE